MGDKIVRVLKKNLVAIITIVISMGVLLYFLFTTDAESGCSDSRIRKISFFLLSAPVISFSIDFLTLPAHANVSD